jgi:hypothetical protein
MQPGHIRVFDGLRVSTEHIDHFQGSLHSAIGDVRRILGLGRVHRGFGVARDGEGVIVQPGLAFDFTGNRLVADEAIPLAVPPNRPAYVCIGYAQVEAGVVDGHPTLIFDSVAADVRVTPPTPGENVLVLATLVASAGDSDAPFDVMPGRLHAALDAPASTGGNGALAPNGRTPEPVTATTASSSPPASPAAIRVHQDVLRLRSDTASRDAVIVLERSMERTDANGAGPTPSAVLASGMIPANFTVASVTCHAAFEASLASDVTVRCRGMSHGDATFGEGGLVGQQCVAETEIEVTSSDAVARSRGATVSQTFVAGLPFAPGRATTSPDTGMGLPVEVLAGLGIGVALGAPTDDGVPVSCVLFWDGPGSTVALQWLTDHAPALEWTADVAWKAIGTTVQNTVAPGSDS